MFEKVARIQIVVFAVILGLSLICAFVFGAKLISNNFSKDEITVTGSASEIVTSDSGVWKFQIRTESPSRSEAYKALSNQKPVVVQFLKSKGIKDNEIDFLGINDYAKYKTSPNGYSTSPEQYDDLKSTHTQVKSRYYSHRERIQDIYF